MLFRLIRSWLTLAVIVGALPNTIANGTTEDAVPVMANFNWLLAQVNANAAPIADAALTGSPTAPTLGYTENSTKLATTQFVQTLLSTLGASTGDTKVTLKATPDPTWVMADDGTIGDATSGSSNRANADTAALFTLLYAFADADCPLLTSVGVATTRAVQGAAAVAFGNHCRMTLPLLKGRALAIAGAGAGLTARTLGHALGEETHLLTIPEIPSHSHQHDQVAGATGFSLLNTGGSGDGTGTSTEPTGGGGAHNNMQPSNFLNIMIKL
jgi:hypothetical protein